MTSRTDRTPQADMFDGSAFTSWRPSQLDRIARALGEGFRRVGPCRLDPMWRGRQWAVWRSAAHTLVFRLEQGERPELAGIDWQPSGQDAQVAWAVLWSAGDMTRDAAREDLMTKLEMSR